MNDGIVVGHYYIWQSADGRYWIVHESGEAMEVPAEKLEKAIDELFKKEF